MPSFSSLNINPNLLQLNSSNNHNDDADELLLESILADGHNHGTAGGIDDVSIEDLIGRIKDYKENRDASVFNVYLPYRNSIQDDPQKLAEYESLVNSVVEKVNLVSSEESFDPDSSEFAQIQNQTELNDTTKYLVGALMAESFNGRPDLLEKATDGVQIGFFDIPEESGAAALYSPSDRAIVVDPEEFFVGLVNPNDQYDPFRHEVMHALEGADSGRGAADGIFSSMNPEQIATFVNERSKLTDAESVSPTGIREYAFSQDAEFAAVITSETFFGNPELLKSKSPELYDVLADYFNTDPLSYMAA